MVSELTGNYNLLLPTLWVCAIAFLLSDEQSIYSSQVESHSRSPAHQGAYIRDVLSGMNVSQFLTPSTDVPTIQRGDRLSQVTQRLSTTNYHALPVTDPENHLLGVISIEEVYRTSQYPHLDSLILATDLMRTNVTPLTPEDRLDRALELFAESDLLALPVVDGSPEGRVIGIVKRSDISSEYLRHVHGIIVPRNRQA